MKKNKVILKANSFKYPTEEERLRIKHKMPTIKRLTLDYQSTFVQIMNSTPYEEAVKNENVYWWNNCLDNRIGKLSQTYIYLSTHYERFQHNELNQTDWFLFDYYLEIFYHYFFSTRDVLAQLLNIHFDLKMPEDKIFFNKTFALKLKPYEEQLSEAAELFIKETGEAYNFRNAFSHRFTPTLKDNRTSPILEQTDTISFEQLNNNDPDMIINMKRSSDLMNSLSELMNCIDDKLIIMKKI